MNKKTVDKLSSRADVSEICAILDNDSEINIPQLKLYDFLIDVRGTNKYGEIICNLKKELKTGTALNYIREVEAINQIFSECTKLQNAINLVPSQVVLPLMLYWGSYNVNEFESPKTKAFLKDYNVNQAVSYEKYAEMTIRAIKSLMHNERVYDGDKFIL